MLTQISLMPTSRRCFGNPSSIVPSKAVCTKHRVLCTQQTRPSRGTLIPSAVQSRGEVSPLRIYAMATTRFVPRAFRRLFPTGYRELHSRREAVSPRFGLLAGRGGQRQTHVRAFCVSFVCASRSPERAMIFDRHRMGLK